MKTASAILAGLGFLSGVSFLVFWVLAWTRLVPPGEPMIISCGVMLLVTGLFMFGAAADRDADRGTWARSDVKIGRVSAFAIGTFFCAVAAAMLGSFWLPKQFGIAMAVVASASFLLAWFGARLDGRRARAENPQKTTGQHGAEQPPSP